MSMSVNRPVESLAVKMPAEARYTSAPGTGRKDVSTAMPHRGATNGGATTAQW